MNEIWAPITGASQYEVSNLGGVRMIGGRKERKPYKVGTGYLQVDIRDDHGIVRRMLVHRLVALAFITRDPRRPHVNHLDGVKSNNRAVNLEWVTPSENSYHAYRYGLRLPLRRVVCNSSIAALMDGMSLEEFRKINPMARKTAKRIRDEAGAPIFSQRSFMNDEAIIRAAIDHPGTIRECAEHLGISKSVVHRIRARCPE